MMVMTAKVWAEQLTGGWYGFTQELPQGKLQSTKRGYPSEIEALTALQDLKNRKDGRP